MEDHANHKDICILRASCKHYSTELEENLQEPNKVKLIARTTLSEFQYYFEKVLQAKIRMKDVSSNDILAKIMTRFDEMVLTYKVLRLTDIWTTDDVRAFMSQLRVIHGLLEEIIAKDLIVVQNLQKMKLE